MNLNIHLMKSVFLAFCLIPSIVLSQIVITQSDMPAANDTFRVSISSDSIDIELTGANVSWDFSYLQPDSQRVDTFFPVSSAPLGYQLYFNNAVFYPDYASDFCVKGQDFNFQLVQMQNVYDFFKISNTVYEQTGIGATVNGLPSSLKFQPKEKLYTFPLTYQSTDSSDAFFDFSVPNVFYYGQFRHRTYLCDGYGTLTTPYGTFDALRVKTLLRIQDSLFIDSLGIGFKIPRPDEYIYTWLSKDDKHPLLTVKTRSVLGSEAVFSIEYRDHVISNTTVATSSVSNKKKPEIWLNPAEKKIIVRQQTKTFHTLYLYNLNGQLILSAPLSDKHHEINVSSLAQGNYLYVLSGGFMPATGKIFISQ